MTAIEDAMNRGKLAAARERGGNVAEIFNFGDYKPRSGAEAVFQPPLTVAVGQLI